MSGIEKRMENLKPCKPGETANPNGRPKGRKSISTYLKLFIEGGLENLPNEELRKQLQAQGFDTVSAALAFKKLSLALSSKVKPDTQLRAMDSIENRLEGSPMQKTEVTSKQEIESKVRQLPSELLDQVCDKLEEIEESEKNNGGK
jgi:hypothetical protein